MKNLYIHCGLHKTGTTALQNALKDNAAKLFKYKILYPNVGVPTNHAGQHNLAWQMLRYRRFDPAFGDWSALLTAIKNYEGSVVLSSEDFEGTFFKPSYWKDIVSKFSKLGFQVVFVIYLRDPITYLESIYLEHLKSGNGDEYLKTFDTVSDSKQLSYDGRKFCFDYAGIQKSMSAVAGVKLIFRNYHHLIGDSIIDDFEDLLNIQGVLSQSLISDKKKNLRNPIQTSLKLFARNRTWSWFQQPSPQKIYRVLDLLITHDKFKLTTPAKMRALLNDRLIESNNYLQSINDSNTKTRFTSKKPVERSGGTLSVNTLLDIQRVFSFETYIFLVNISRSFKNSEIPKDAAHFEPQIQVQIAKWWRWVELPNKTNNH